MSTESSESRSCTEPGIEFPTMPRSKDDSKEQLVTSYSSGESQDDESEPDED